LSYSSPNLLSRESALLALDFQVYAFKTYYFVHMGLGIAVSRGSGRRSHMHLSLL